MNSTIDEASSISEAEERHITQRFAKAEKRLATLLDKQSFPNLNRYIFEHAADLRVITDAFPFADNTDPSSINEDEWKATKATGFIRPNPIEEGKSLFTVLYEPHVTETDRDMIGKTYSAILTSIITAILLDPEDAKQLAAKTNR